MIESEVSRRVYKLIGGGIIVFGFGLWLLTLGALTGQLFIPVSVLALGFGTLLYGLILGIRTAYADDSKKEVTMHADVYIVARIMETTKHEVVVDPEMYPEEQLVRLVQIRFPDGNVRELTAEPEVFKFTGEGMSGTVHVQGGSLVAFQWDRREDDPETSQFKPDPFYHGKKDTE
jgi:hypothetical protein